MRISRDLRATQEVMTRFTQLTYGTLTECFCKNVFWYNYDMYGRIVPLKVGTKRCLWRWNKYGGILIATIELDQNPWGSGDSQCDTDWCIMRLWVYCGQLPQLLVTFALDIGDGDIMVVKIKGYSYCSQHAYKVHKIWNVHVSVCLSLITLHVDWEVLLANTEPMYKLDILPQLRIKSIDPQPTHNF